MDGIDVGPKEIMVTCKERRNCEYHWCDHYEPHVKARDCEKRMCISKGGKVRAHMNCQKEEDNDFESMF